MSGNNGRMAGSALGRESLVAEALLLAVRDVPPPPGPALVVADPTDRVRAALRGTAWRRVAQGAEVGQALPPPCAADAAGYALATVRLDRDRAGRDFAVHQAAAALAPGGELWLYGANDEGIKSPGEAFTALLDGVEMLAARRHCRVWRGRRTAAKVAEVPARGGLESWWAGVEGGGGWRTLPGVFAKGGVDAASELLLETITGPEGRLAAPPAPGEAVRVLDFGCGAGVLSAGLLSAVQARLALEALDADALAVEVTRRNVPEAKVFSGDGFTAIGDHRYHRILSNPPIHAGKAEDFGVLRRLVAEAPAHLLPGGDLWLVVQRQVPVDPLLGQVFGRVRLAAETGRFRVWCATEPR